MRPASSTSIAGTTTVAPAAAASSSAASAFATVTYTDQNGGMPGFCDGPSPATLLPRSVATA